MAAAGNWAILLKDRLPAYISWVQFEDNLRQLQANSSKGQGAIRHGPSLLAGLVFCGVCGRRMKTAYRNNGSELRYECSALASDYGLPRCQSLTGRVLDEFVGQQVLVALQPAALEVSLKAAEEVEAEREQLHENWRQRLERAHYQAERAYRQFNAVEPENRLVVRSLERQWEQALAEEAQLQTDYAHFLDALPATLTAAERLAIQQLSSDIPGLWHAATTTSADRQAIIRQVVERVIVSVQGESEKIDVQVRWIGGGETRAALKRPVARLEQLSNYPQLLARVATLHAQGYHNADIAETLNTEGWRPAKRRETFNASMVATLKLCQGLQQRRSPHEGWFAGKAGEWTLPELAQHLNIPSPTLYNWLYRGVIKGRRVIHAKRPLWLIQADAAELARLRALRTARASKF